MPQYLDANGNPLASSATTTYLDANGNPIPPVPQSSPASAPAKSLWQRAKDNFNANTQGAKPGDGIIKSFIENVGAGGGDVLRSIANLPTTIDTMTSTPDPTMAEAAHLMGDDTALNKVNATTYPNAARTIGQFGTGAILGKIGGEIAAPAIDASGKLASRVLLLGKTPQDAYESALKPSTTLSQDERAAIVKTGLDNSIPVSKGGVEALGDRIDKLNQEIANVIASDPNRPIDPNSVATRADLARAKFAKQVNAQSDLNAIEASRQQFLKEQGARPGTPAVPASSTGLVDAQGNPIMRPGTPAQPPTPAPPMNAEDAQAMKQGTYRVLKGKYGEQGSASTEAQKSLAYGLKDELATQFPELGNLNATESRLLDLQPVLERAVNRISNHQLIGIGTPVAGAAADAVAGPGVGRVAMVMKSVLDNPNVKSRLAISLSKGAKIPYAQAAARVAAYSSALGSTVQGLQGNSSADTPSQ